MPVTARPLSRIADPHTTLIAMRVHSGPGDPSTKHFFLSDHLGGTSTVLSAAGAVEETQPYSPSGKYYPFGAPRSGGITLTDKPARRGEKFTGQQEEMGAPDFGTYYYGARFYSTALGRFLSPDPLVAGSTGLTSNLTLGNVQAGGAPASSQSLNRYGYAGNNPIRYTDPTGLCFVNPMTGKMMECSADLAARLLACAYSAAACRETMEGLGIYDLDWCAVSAFASYGVQTFEFRNSFNKYLPEWDQEYLQRLVGSGNNAVFYFRNRAWQMGLISDPNENRPFGLLDQSINDFMTWAASRSDNCYIAAAVLTGSCGPRAVVGWAAAGPMGAAYAVGLSPGCNALITATVLACK